MTISLLHELKHAGREIEKINEISWSNPDKGGGQGFMQSPEMAFLPLWAFQ